MVMTVRAQALVNACSVPPTSLSADVPSSVSAAAKGYATGEPASDLALAACRSRRGLVTFSGARMVCSSRTALLGCYGRAFIVELLVGGTVCFSCKVSKMFGCPLFPCVCVCVCVCE
jgi:hypothetical protein